MSACTYVTDLFLHMVVLQDFLEHADAGPLRDALYSGSTKLVEAAFVYQLVRELCTKSLCCDFTQILYKFMCKHVHVLRIHIYSTYIHVCAPPCVILLRVVLQLPVGEAAVHKQLELRYMGIIITKLLLEHKEKWFSEREQQLLVSLTGVVLC